ncbi:MAG: hypothetical protein DWQ01_16660 [Planctomycetota bacterium]|nr:MAG: hypothetical protein DWQ01_16660 [Planctomycetota bacterium]
MRKLDGFSGILIRDRISRLGDQGVFLKNLMRCWDAQSAPQYQPLAFHMEYIKGNQYGLIS